MRISVITVAFNSSQTIGDTLDSVASQTYSEVEHLVIDGASKDASLDLIRGHANERIRCFSEPDRGIYDAMNKGLKAASGDVIGFLNSDDMFADREVLTRIAGVFEDPQVDICFGDLVYVSFDNQRIVRYWKSRAFIPGDFARGWCPAHPTFYVRRRALEQAGLFDLDFPLAADNEFMMRYLELLKARSVYLPWVQVRMRLGGATNASLGNVLAQNREIFTALRKNKIPFSTFGFLARKLTNRFVQFAVGYARVGS
jgi:glycosyltransferase involved in cell wall biosynthesis